MKNFLHKMIVLGFILSMLFYLIAPISIANNDMNSNHTEKNVINENNTDENFMTKDNDDENNNKENSVTEDTNANEDNNINTLETEKSNINENKDEDFKISEDTKNSIEQILNLYPFFRKLNSNGIYIQEYISSDVLKILNFNSIYTYDLNENLKLESDNQKKINEFIDTKNETEVDIIIKNINIIF